MVLSHENVLGSDTDVHGVQYKLVDSVTSALSSSQKLNDEQNARERVLTTRTCCSFREGSRPMNR